MKHPKLITAKLLAWVVVASAAVSVEPCPKTHNNKVNYGISKSKSL
jgi:hypothetical protein